ncbi:hypothetical protein TNCV_533431 [Trichonephila clavipes]|nr:hypothetical protein TNCV_533431 [Trichonephila clavipes]
MARYRVSSARRVSHLSEFDALARKDTVWPCVSLAMSVATPGHDLVFNLSPSTHDGTLVSLEPVKKTQGDARRRRSRRLLKCFSTLKFGRVVSPRPWFHAHQWCRLACLGSCGS